PRARRDRPCRRPRPRGGPLPGRPAGRAPPLLRRQRDRGEPARRGGARRAARADLSGRPTAGASPHGDGPPPDRAPARARACRAAARGGGGEPRRRAVRRRARGQRQRRGAPARAGRAAARSERRPAALSLRERRELPPRGEAAARAGRAAGARRGRGRHHRDAAAPRAGGERAGAAGGGARARPARHGRRGDGTRRPRSPRRAPRGVSPRRPRGRGPRRHPRARGPALQSGAKMAYAKRAALEVVDQLGPRDLVGAIAFDSEPYELGPLLPLAEGRAALTAKIRQLRYGGGTDFKEALDRARRSLVAAGRRVRHVVLLTDGDTNRSAPDHDHLIADLARDDVTVTTIRIGHDTVNLDLLNKISRAT